MIATLARPGGNITGLSPMAAESYWVNREVSYWLKHGGRDRLLIVLAAGQLHRDDEQARLVATFARMLGDEMRRQGIVEKRIH